MTYESRLEPAPAPDNLVTVTPTGGIDLTLGTNIDRRLSIGLSMALPAPLGDVRIVLTAEQTAQLFRDLGGLLALTGEQVAALVNHVHEGTRNND